MRQVLFEVPGLGLKLYGFGALLVAALFASTIVAVRRARRERLDPEMFYDISFWVVVGGVIGARLLYVAQYPQAVRQFWDIFKIWQGGIVFYGSAIGGVVGFLAYWRWKQFPLRAGLDVLALAVPMGLAFGRIGCFLNGCCYGDICHLPWAVQFPAHTLPWANHVHNGLISAAAPASLPVHPTQLYSAFDGFLLFGLLTVYYPLRRRDGEVMALLMVTYPITRFLIERLRNDEGAFFAGMTISQNISIIAFVMGLIFWAWLVRQPAIRHADQPAAPVRDVQARPNARPRASQAGRRAVS